MESQTLTEILLIMNAPAAGVQAAAAVTLHYAVTHVAVFKQRSADAG